MATILIPTPLRKFTGNLSRITVSGTVIAEIIHNMMKEYPDMQKYLLDTEGAVRPFINIFVDQDDIRSLNDQLTEVDAHSVVSIVPAIAGGGAICPDQTVFPPLNSSSHGSR
ncbi:MoaD/ThiS family protein [Pedobacter sp. AW31-3R]|uniref:MoaD/ThiS family protein n=1 Tax=Pedobacter sp. AW31-3R TaxID=3445781 RepID=UPI003F9FFF3C